MSRAPLRSASGEQQPTAPPAGDHVRLMALGADRNGWEDARERAEVALAAKKVQLRGGKGAELSIRVTSDLKLPSGTSADGLAQKRTVFSLDPSDVGARPQRVVHAHLESFKLL